MGPGVHIQKAPQAIPRHLKLKKHRSEVLKLIHVRLRGWAPDSRVSAFSPTPGAHGSWGVSPFEDGESGDCEERGCVSNSSCGVRGPECVFSDWMEGKRTAIPVCLSGTKMLTRLCLETR